jgi:hypothetical protein
MSGLPLPQCRSSVERAYDGYTEDFDAAFDLRDEL